MAPKYETSYTLIGRALDLDDHDAWEQLNEYYSKFIYYLLTNMDVRNEDRDELHQIVLIRLMKALKQYDQKRGKFRTWFAELVRREVLGFFRSQKTFQNSMPSLEAENVPEQSIDESDLDQQIQQEWKSYMIQVVMGRLRTRFRGNAIEIFELGSQGYKTDEICEKLGLSHSTVYTLRKRVKNFLREETESLTKNMER